MASKKKLSVLIALVLAVTTVFSVPLTVNAEPEDVVECSEIIVSLEELNEEIINQEIVAYSGNVPNLPSELVGETESGEKVAVKASWTPDKSFEGNIAGIYQYTGTLTSEYQIAETVQLPIITVKVIKCTTTITDVEESTCWRSRGSAYDTITVKNGYGRVLKHQMWNGSQWVTKKSVTLKNTNSQKIKFYYTNDWWKVTSSKWRFTIASNEGATSYTSKTTNLKTKRYYQNPSRYIQIQDKITIDNSGAYTLKYGYMGLKTRQVNRYFGIGSKYWPRYTSTTKSKVKSFQRKKGLKVTGNVNKATWLKMGYSESSWNNMGAYVSPIKVNPSSTKTQHIEAMIDRAYDYLGSDYVVGASGTPKQGADCSGLVMQALYAAGVEIPGINPVTHSKAGHEYESRNMWNKAKFKKVSYSNRKRGDLIFYHSGGVVIHVAIYLGNNKVIESWPNKVRVARVDHHAIKGVMRVFN